MARQGEFRVAALVLVALILIAVPAIAHETQGSPNTTNINQCGGSGNVCLHNNASPGSCYDDEATGCYLANYSGSDSTYVSNTYPFPTSGSPNLNQSVSNVKNAGNSCSVYLRDLPGFTGWVFGVGLGIQINTTGGYDDDASAHHWCTYS